MARAAGRRPARGLITLLLLVALIALVVGVYYFATPADKIPSWLPGRVATSTAHHVRRAIAAIVLAVLCAIAAWLMGRRPRSAR